MKLNFSKTINASLEQVWAAFDNPDNLTRWQPNLKSFSHRSGIKGQPGAVSELIYDEKSREVVLTETITERRAPDFLAGEYDNKWCRTVIVNHFRKIDNRSTTWESWCNFSFKGPMKFMALFLRGSMRSRTECDMDRFKLMVETDLAGAGQ